ncbi:TetR/AcrR family transcriptional regulator [Nostoc sp. NIES-2111]
MPGVKTFNTLETLNQKKVSLVLHPLYMSMQDPTRTRILEGAEQLFFRYGIRTISMDEVARHLAMSKKTLYQHFENKEDLVFQIAQKHMDEDCRTWEQLHAQCVQASALVEMLMLTQMVRKEMADINPIIVHELKRFHPRAWKLLENQREDLFEKSIISNIVRGKTEGFYRADVDPKVSARARMIMLLMSFDPDVFPPTEFEFAHVQDQMMEHFVRGLLTEKGIREWEQLKKDPNPLAHLKPIKPITA